MKENGFARDLLIELKHFVKRKTENLPDKPNEEFPSEDCESASRLWYEKADKVLLSNLNEFKFGVREIMLGSLLLGASVSQDDYLSLPFACGVAVVLDGFRRFNKNDKFFSTIFDEMRKKEIMVFSSKKNINK